MDSFNSGSHQQNTYGYGGNYGSGYGGYGYGYGYGYGGGGGGNKPSSNVFSDVVLILRERIWYIVSIFLIILTLALIYTFSRTKIYESAVSMQIMRREVKITSNPNSATQDVVNQEDFNTILEVLKSSVIIQRVADRLTGEDLRQFMAPYERGKNEDPLSPGEVLGRNREIIPLRLTLFVRITYRHPDRFMAAKVANLFADEFISYGKRGRSIEMGSVGESINIHLQQQEKKVRELEAELLAYREKYEQISLDPTKDIVTDEVKQKNAFLTQAIARFNETEVRWLQVETRLSNKSELAKLSFIAGQSVIDLLTKDVANKKIILAQISDRYKEKHPAMIEARNSLAQSERELERALENAAAVIQSEYTIAKRSMEQAKVSLEEAEKKAMELDRLQVQYTTKKRELDVNIVIFQGLVAKQTEADIDTAVETQKARIVDRAGPSGESGYVSPNIPLNIALGAFGGLFLGVTFAFFIAYIDDRVKSSFDIETVIGIPLIGIIPRLKHLSQSEKAQVAASHLDSHITEAFLSLHSNLRLKELSKNAKCILVTSSIPGEGKSFTVTNLAITMAAHGEKVAIVDCDLRKPNIHRSFRLDNTKGVIDICAGMASIDEVAVTGLHENLTVIMSGGRAKNPTQIIGSREFEAMVSELRKRYDRIFFDTPPLVPVSDSLIMMPLMDGAIFTIFFNKVRRKVAQFSAQKLRDSQMPVFGAVLNGLATSSTSGYYYAQYAHKAAYGYGYHTHKPAQPRTEDEKIVDPKLPE